MSRLKFDAKQEYAYLDNFKVLQQCFKKNGIEKVRNIADTSRRCWVVEEGFKLILQPIPVEKLVKWVASVGALQPLKDRQENHGPF